MTSNIEIEQRWRDSFAKDKIYESQINDQKKFLITVPYPYTSGALHIGHGRTFSTADFIARFKRKQGLNILFPIAYHVSGTPVIAVCDGLKSGDKKTLDMTKEYILNYEPNLSEKELQNVIDRIKEPSDFAQYFAQKFAQDFRNLGLAMDFTREFTTMDKWYNDFITWQFTKLYKNGYIIKQSYPVLFDPIDKNAVGEDDIKDGDTDPVNKTEFTSLKFELVDKSFITKSSEKIYLIASTLRPETINGVTNLWVNLDSKYIAFKAHNDIYITSKEAYEKIKYQIDLGEVITELSGKDLIEKKASFNGKEVSIYDGTFVNPSIGTGIVFSVPAHALFDYLGLIDAKNKYSSAKGIEPISIIDLKGYSKFPAKDMCEKLGINSITQVDLITEGTKALYKDEFYSGVMNSLNGKYSGKLIKDMKDSFISEIIKEGLAFKFYDTSRDALTRSGHRVVVSMLKDQWFLDYSNPELKERVKEHIKSIEVLPEKYKSQMLGAIDWIDKRPCARKRGLGTPLPQDKEWVIESLSDSTIYMAFYTIANTLIPLYKENLKKNPNYSLPFEFFDFIFSNSGNIKEISKFSGISEKDIAEMKMSFEYWYGVNLRHTAPAHISNHIAFYFMNHAMLFDKKYWPQAQSFNDMLIREGQKMSKSKGNIISIRSVTEKYGIDLYRLYVASNSDLDSVVDWRESEVEGLKKKFNSFVETISNSIANKQSSNIESLEEIFISKIYQNLYESYEAYEKYRFRDVCVKGLFNILNDLKEYEKFGGKNTHLIVNAVLKDWLMILEPIIPYTTQHFYSQISKGFIYNETLNKNSLKKNTKSLSEYEYISSVITDVKKILEISTPKENKLYLYTAPDWKWTVQENIDKAMPEILKLLPEQNPKDVSDIYIKLKKSFFKAEKCNESAILSEWKPYLESYLKFSIEINSSHDPKDKKKYSMPLRPSIYLE